MTEKEVSAFLNLMHTTHNISITFTPIGEKSVDANTNAPAPAITEERVLELIREHTATASDALKESIEEAIEEHDFDDAISSAVDDAISGKDWEYELKDSLDYDKIADRVAEKIDWSQCISDNDIITRDDIDVDDIMLKSEELNEDEIVKQADLADRVYAEMKRDWFAELIKEEMKKFVLEKQLPSLVAKAIHQLFVRASDYATEIKKPDETSNIQQRQDS
jgi:hypothetical protein